MCVEWRSQFTLRNLTVWQQLHYLSIPMGKAQTCRTKVIDLNDGVSQYAWYPCTANFQYSHMAQTIFWLKAYFSTPMVAAAVLVHLVTDGTYYLDQKQETIGVQLFDTKEQSHDLGVHVLSCRNNPLIIPVIHDLSHPFYHTQAVLISFSSQFVAISGVALRSFHNFDPITVSSCQRGQTYSPAEQSCVHYSCEATDCQKLEIDNALLNCTGGGWYNGAQCNVSCRTGYILQVQRDDDLSKSQVFQARICGTCMQEMNYQSNSRICGLDSSHCVVLNCMVLLPQIFPSFGSSSDHKQLEMRWDTWLVISAHGTSCFSIKLVVLSLLSFSWVCVLVRLIGGTRAVFFLLN